MIYHLHNQQDAAKAIAQIGLADTQFSLSDFQWFITTICEAIDKRLLTNLRYNSDSPKGLDEYQGTIESAELTFDPNNQNPTILTIKFTDKSTGKTQTATYSFNPALVKENTNSIPGNFMKYYINDDHHQVIVGIIVNYK